MSLVNTVRRKLALLWSRNRNRVRTPTVLQMEAVECGAAALGIVLAYYKRFVPLEELRVRCGISRDGSKASNILKAARSYGLLARGLRLEPKALGRLPLPLIVHWNFNHFLVVEGFDDDRVYLNDPAGGPRTVTHAEFDRAFTGIVLTFAPGEAFEPGGERYSLRKQLAEMLRRSEWALAFVFLASLLLVIPGLLVPLFSQVFVDYYLSAGRTQWIIPLLIGMALTAALRSGLMWLQQTYLLRLETRLNTINSGRLFWHLMRLPIEFFNQRSAGDISARIGSNARIAQLLSGRLSTSLLNVLLVGFYAALMFRYSVVLTLTVIAVASVNLLVLRYVSRQRKDANQRLLKDRGQMMSTAFAGLQGIETIKASGQESDYFARWAGEQAKVVNATQELGAVTQMAAIVPQVLNQLSTVLILGLGGLAIIRGEMTAGMLVAFQTLAASFAAPVNQLTSVGNELQEIEGILKRLRDVSDYPSDTLLEVAGTSEVSADSTPKLSGRVEFRNVTFGYSLLDPPLIEDFNLTLEPGTRVALVGPSGSGKSTVARLLNGLYQPWSGSILLDGVPRQEVPRAVLTGSMASVDQEIFLFEGSIRDNLTMWDSNVPDPRLMRAAADAEIHDVIVSRPDGYDAHVAEGGRNFSGGQRQRLEIARALIHDPAVVVLDEATSALDPLTEHQIDSNLRRRGCTCLIVAHRLSTIRDCDEILVMLRGKVVERGTHDELWARRGPYYHLIRTDDNVSDLLLDSIMETIAA